MGLQSLLQEEKKATEDPYLEMDTAQEIPVESHEERVGYSMADVSEQIRCTFLVAVLRIATSIRSRRASAASANVDESWPQLCRQTSASELVKARAKRGLTAT